MTDSPHDKERERQIHLIGRLATVLPWITVGAVAFAALVTIIQILMSI